MVHCFKIVNDKIELNVVEILKFPPLAVIYQRDDSPNKEYAHKEFLYINHIGDKKGYCKSKGLGPIESHKWAVRNSGFISDYIPDKIVKEAIKFIEDELSYHPVEEVIETTVRGMNASLKMIKLITDDLQSAIESPKGDMTVSDLLTYEENIKRLIKYANEIPERVEELSKLRTEWDNIEKGVTMIRGGKVYKESYDGTDDLSPKDSGRVESLN